MGSYIAGSFRFDTDAVVNSGAELLRGYAIHVEDVIVKGDFNGLLRLPGIVPMSTGPNGPKYHIVPSGDSVMKIRVFPKPGTGKAKVWSEDDDITYLWDRFVASKMYFPSHS